ncbi:MAG: VCBS repeat-containing protein, partial [Bacteroidales bacterium]
MKRISIAVCIIISMILPGRSIVAQCCQFTWQQQVEPATSAATFGVALGDFDNDGDMDAVSISAYYGIDVYFNDGSGTFTLGAQYATGTNGNFYGVHVADVDNDNDLDIIAIPFYTSTPMAILKNNGAGVFAVTTASSSIATYNAAIGDLDGDNDIDIFLPNSGGGSGKIFKNNGTGSYTLYQTLSGARGHCVSLGDLDNDGDLDAFVVENSSYGYSVFLNDSTGMFTQLGTTFGTNGSFVALGDLDKDGDLDAWVGKSNNNSEIWLNNGSGVFSLHSTITNGSYCKSVVLYDFDNDGFQDVFMSFYSSAPQVWKNHGDLTFSLCYQAPVGSSSHGQAVGFLDGDSYIDIYTGHFSNTDGDYVFLNSSPLISYAGSPFCPNDPTPQQINLTGTPGGVYTSNPYGLSLDSVTGTFIPLSSLAGNYFVYYTQSGCTVHLGGGCDPQLSSDAGEVMLADFCEGDVVTVTWTVTDLCIDDIVVSADFTITAAPAITYDVLPQDASYSACEFEDQAEAIAAFNAWVDAQETNLNLGGGCDPQLSSDAGEVVLADICEGGTVTVTWTVSDLCIEDIVVSADFTIIPPDPV